MSAQTVDPSLRSWVSVPEGSDFPIQNLPFGIFRRSDRGDERPRIGVAIGDSVLDLHAVHGSGVMRLGDAELGAGVLNPMLAMPGRLSAVRRRVSELLSDGNDELAPHRHDVIVPREAVVMELPVAIGDYVDFYSSIHHATNMGRLFRPDAEPLLPNWRYLPVGYHGRASTVVVSGTDVVRPSGQRRGGDGGPIFGPTEKLDIELEVGFVAGPPTPMGQSVPLDAAEQHVAGLLLVNDWSARDIQAWEYVPLGPFLGKSFATTASPWLVTMDALEPYRVPAPHQEPDPPSYLRGVRRGVDIDLEVELNGTVVSRPGFGSMYWTMAQQVAHMTSNGTSMRTGDLYASGTVSGPDAAAGGSLIELSGNGATPLSLGHGEERAFLQDGDSVVLRGSCDNGSVRIGFGECAGTVVAARERKGTKE